MSQVNENTGATHRVTLFDTLILDPPRVVSARDTLSRRCTLSRNTLDALFPHSFGHVIGPARRFRDTDPFGETRHRFQNCIDITSSCSLLTSTSPIFFLYALDFAFRCGLRGHLRSCTRRIPSMMCVDTALHGGLCECCDTTRALSRERLITLREDGTFILLLRRAASFADNLLGSSSTTSTSPPSFSSSSVGRASTTYVYGQPRRSTPRYCYPCARNGSINAERRWSGVEVDE